MTDDLYADPIAFLSSIIDDLISLPVYIPKHIRSRIEQAKNLRQCSRCKKWKPLDAFDIKKNGSVFRFCIECTDKNRSRNSA